MLIPISFRFSSFLLHPFAVHSLSFPFSFAVHSLIFPLFIPFPFRFHSLSIPLPRLLSVSILFLFSLHSLSIQFPFFYYFVTILFRTLHLAFGFPSLVFIITRLLIAKFHSQLFSNHVISLPCFIPIHSIFYLQH